MSALTLTEDELSALVEKRVAELLSPERVEALAERHIADRIGLLTLEQAARQLQCKNVRQLTDFCREHQIPIEHFGAKKRFIRVEKIEAAQRLAQIHVGSEAGTVVGRVAA